MSGAIKRIRFSRCRNETHSLSLMPKLRVNSGTQHGDLDWQESKRERRLKVAGAPRIKGDGLWPRNLELQNNYPT